MKERQTMKLSEGEKLILIMLSEIHGRLQITNGVDPKFVQSAIYSGNLWGLKWGLPGIFHDSEPADEDISEVVDILDMWSRLEESHEKLPTEEKERVKKEADLYGSHVHFTGFDGHTDSSHIGVARFLVEQLGRFSNLKGRDFDSHMPLSLDRYRRMLIAFKPLRTASDLTATEIIKILNAGLYPEHRTPKSKRSDILSVILLVT
jgi:uncharacterized protein